MAVSTRGYRIILKNGTHYDIELQALQKNAIERRSRYYHSQMDMEFLLSGEEYDKLPNSYVIFICDFDPFGKGNIVTHLKMFV